MTSATLWPGARGITVPRKSKAQAWTGRVISGLCVSFLLVDAAIKLMRATVAVEGTMRAGYPEGVIVPLGIVLLICTLLYAFPRTSVFGAILLTGYLGGATATHVRLSEPFFMPVAFGVLIWAGLSLRGERVRDVLFARP